MTLSEAISLRESFATGAVDELLSSVSSPVQIIHWAVMMWGNRNIRPVHIKNVNCNNNYIREVLNVESNTIHITTTTVTIQKNDTIGITVKTGE